MVVDYGEKIHVITRRLFEGDVRRHFAGTVTGSYDAAVRLIGYAFVLDASSSRYVKLAGERTRIFDLSDSGFICNVLPPEVDVRDLVYEITADNKLVLTDRKEYQMDINEFSEMR